MVSTVRLQGAKKVKALIFIGLFFMGCYAEFDLGVKTPRKDPCSGVIEDKNVYVMPTCRYAPPQPSR